MGALFGTLSAMSIGLSDLFLRRVALKSSISAVVAALQLFAAVAAAGSLLFVESDLLWRDVALGGIAGIGMAVGLASYYSGVTRSSATIVSPIVGTLAAVIPFLYTVATGSRPSPIGWVGAVVALVGLILITMSDGKSTNVRAGVLWGTLAGCGYGFALSSVIGATTESGSWPAIGQRSMAFLLTIAVARSRNMQIVPARGVRRFAILGGIASGTASVFFLLGVAVEATTTVVTASMFPAFTVLIGWSYYNDAVSTRQVAGLMAALLGVAGVVIS
ncbi:MAG: drug/metabolite transporter (DMT)-like permease [Verrucomicrobiales bacterium]|jgi:drug/metabolite transporter (DMT)-like permease